MAVQFEAQESTPVVEVEDHLSASALGTRDDALGDGFARPDIAQEQVAGVDLAVPGESQRDPLIPWTG